MEQKFKFYPKNVLITDWVDTDTNKGNVLLQLKQFLHKPFWLQQELKFVITVCHISIITAREMGLLSIPPKVSSSFIFSFDNN